MEDTSTGKGFGEKIKNILLHPTNTLRELKEEKVWESLKYYGILLIVFAILSAIIFSLVSDKDIREITLSGYLFKSKESDFLCSFFIILLSGFVGIFVSAGIIHIGVLVVGGKKGYDQTLKALAYGITPAYLLGWIPGIAVVGVVWGLITEIIGVRELQEISTNRAIIAVILSTVVFYIIVAAVVYAYVSSSLTA